MHAIERELIKVTGYKAKRKFSDREDYLKSLLNDVMKLTDDDFDNLTDEAAAWTNAAVDAHNSKNVPIPDFDEVVASEDDENVDESESDGTDEPAEEDENPDEEASEDEDDPEGEVEASEDEPEADEPEDEDEPAPKPAKKKVVAKEKTFKVPPKPKVTAPAVKPKKAPNPDDEEDVVLDKWGCMEGSKNSRALAMFERGATTKEVKDTIGGTYYNILGKCEKNGHKLEKDGAIIKLTHKDANKAPIKKKK